MTGTSFGPIGFGVELHIDRTGMIPDGQVYGVGPLGRPNQVIVGVYEPHAIAKRIVREGLADVLAWLTPERRPNMATGQEILDRLRAVT